MKRQLLLIASLFLLGTAFVFGQAEVLTNRLVMEMAQAGLADEVISVKIRGSETDFDVSAAALLELKAGGVSNPIILAMIERHESRTRPTIGSSESLLPIETEKSVATPKELLLGARTIAFVKSSAQPSRQALEKELLKRQEWKGLDLAIHRYKDTADLYVEIGFVSMSWITHRYVYRIYDRRTGIVLAAGETTSWGSLAQNLATHIARSLAAVARS